MISVIVPVYNTSEYLEKCVLSLLNQTHKDFEIILVDDGSTDNSGKMCDEFSLAHLNVHAHHKTNGGLISAWKYGVTVSSGDYLCFVDSDDWVDSDMLESLFSKTSGSRKEIIASDYVIERKLSDSAYRQEYIYQALRPGTYDNDYIKNELVYNLLGNETRTITVSRCMKLISRTLFTENMHYTDESIRMAEDLSVMFPCFIDCERLVILDKKAFYHYLYIPESMVHKYDSTMYDNFHHLYDICAKVINDKFEDTSKKERMYSTLDSEFVHWLLLCVKNEARGNKLGAKENIRRFHNENKERLKNTSIKLNQKSNVLLYMTIKKPSLFNLFLLDLAMRIYYR